MKRPRVWLGLILSATCSITLCAQSRAAEPISGDLSAYFIKKSRPEYQASANVVCSLDSSLNQILPNALPDEAYKQYQTGKTGKFASAYSDALSYFSDVDDDQAKKLKDSCATLVNSGGVIEALYNNCLAACDHEATGKKFTFPVPLVTICKSACVEQTRKNILMTKTYVASKHELGACEAKMNKINEEIAARATQGNTTGLLRNIKSIPQQDQGHSNSNPAKKSNTAN